MAITFNWKHKDQINRMGKFVPVFVLLFIIPTIIYAQESSRSPTAEDIMGLKNRLDYATTEIDNLQNQISGLKAQLVEVQNRKELDEKFNKLLDEFNKKQFVVTLDEGWTKGDILVASATIFVFFTFGSFLVVKFESENKNRQADILIDVFKLIFVIQIAHLSVIGMIVLNWFNLWYYFAVLVLTGYLLYLIMLGSSTIIALENKIKKRKQQLEESYSKVGDDFDQIREQRRLNREAGE